ncbi:hypothetical protein ES703_16955 [subsurface metagenome]
MIEKIHKLTFRLSPSALNLMKECPRCFWLHQRKVWRRPVGIFPSLPTGMDRILKIHFDKFRDKEELPPELCENHECKDMKLFDDKELLKVWQNNWKGVSFTDKNGNELHGAVDNILVKGKKLIVLDYKTRGYPLKEDTAEHYRLQQNIYNFLLRKNGYQTEDYFFLLFYIPNEVTPTGEVIFDTELIKMKVDVKMAEQIWEKAIKLLNSECPQKGCQWCEGF